MDADGKRRHADTLCADTLHVCADVDGCGWWWWRISERKKEKEKYILSG